MPEGAHDRAWGHRGPEDEGRDMALTEEEFDETMIDLLNRFVIAQEKQAEAAVKQAEASAFQAKLAHETTKIMERGIELQEAMLKEHEAMRRLHEG